ncbi:MAG: UrcA family protein [Steroidobacteraceae bacterium]
MRANRQGFGNLIGAVAIAGCVLQMTSTRVQADSMQQGSTTESSRADLDAPRKVVNYGDLNLSRPEGINTLEARIRRAVDSVCEQSGDKGLSRAHVERECRDAALADAMAQVHELSVSETVAVQSEHKCMDTTVADAAAQVNALIVHEGIGP